MTNPADFYLNMSQFSSMRLDAKNQTGNATEAVAQQFESLMMQQMLASMRSASQIDSSQHSQTADFYQEMYDKQLSLNFSQKGGLGIAEMIVKQIDGDRKVEASTHSTSGLMSFNIAPQLPKLLNPEQQTIKQPIAKSDNQQLQNELATSAYRAMASTPSNSLESYQLPEYQESVSDEVFLEQYQTLNQSVKVTALGSADSIDVESKTETPESFVTSLFPSAQRAAKKLGISTDALIAQSALETGWGKYSMKTVDGLPTNNLFGIKAGSSWEGATVAKPTLEYKDGMMQTEIAHFRVYESIEAGLDDYVSFIETRSRYSDALNHSGNDEHYLRGLQNAGYATDPDYANKILKIADSGRLQNIIAKQLETPPGKESNHA